jgi:double-stranded uracil-DNA glycosylase
LRRTKSPAATSSGRPSAKDRPDKDALARARGKKLKDVIAPGLRVLFCGINPGLYSAATGNHFARPGNRFWPALHASGFTPRRLHPSDESVLLSLGCGLTNLVERATANAEELAQDELAAGAWRLARKVRAYRPRLLAVLGLGAFRQAFGAPRAMLGRQPDTFEGAVLWVLPSPSGLNANYQLGVLVELFRELRIAAWRRNSARRSGASSASKENPMS